jgi:sulfofructose kinase
MSESALDIVGVGLATLDVLVRLERMPTWEQGAPLSAFGLDGGGPVATALVAATRLGARCGFVGTCGDDLAAELKMRFLAREGLDLSRLVKRPAPENQVVLVCVQQSSGERVFCGLRDFGAQPLRVDELDHDYITSARYLHLDGSHHEAVLQAAQWMHAAGKPVMLDAARVTAGARIGLAELIPHVDYLICGSGFAPYLTGVEDNWEACRALLRRGPRVVVQTEGAQGSYTVTAEEAFHTPAFAVEVVDTTGAGDVFHGAFLVGLLHGWDLRYIVQFASAVAALKCGKLGGRAGIPRLEQVLTFLEARGMGDAKR